LILVESYPGATDSDTSPALVSGSVVVELSPVAPNELPCGAIGAVMLPALVSGSVVVELSPVAPNELPCGAIGAVMLAALCAAMDWPKKVIRPRATIVTISNIAIFILSIYNRSYKTLVLIVFLMIKLNQVESIAYLFSITLRPGIYVDSETWILFALVLSAYGARQLIFVPSPKECIETKGATI
jgi:hypothetical protein